MTPRSGCSKIRGSRSLSYSRGTSARARTNDAIRPRRRNMPRAPPLSFPLDSPPAPSRSQSPTLHRPHHFLPRPRNPPVHSYRTLTQHWTVRLVLFMVRQLHVSHLLGLVACAVILHILSLVFAHFGVSHTSHATNPHGWISCLSYVLDQPQTIRTRQSYG